MIDLSEKLLRVRHVVAMEPHIVLDDTRCESCDLQSCLYVCPAGCFTLEDGQIQFSYEGCLECGTCRVVCPNKALTWDYPLGGYGVSFRYG
ncbi:MAG: 4Fe-4S binding protein [Anaerolineales bacterium]|nr:4Fe-4S binding protein [Anaerolineales bacterium]